MADGLRALAFPVQRFPIYRERNAPDQKAVVRVERGKIFFRSNSSLSLQTVEKARFRNRKGFSLMNTRFLADPAAHGAG